MREHLLAIDNGTQSVRALIFDLRGNLVAKAQVHIEPYFSRQPGWAEQNPEYYWGSLCQACQQLWERSSIDKASIAGVALTTQRATVINVDKTWQSVATGHRVAGSATYRGRAASGWAVGRGVSERRA